MRGCTSRCKARPRNSHSICRRSFLSLWSYANPRARTKAELCDVLVVCDPNVIIISVKDVAFNSVGDPEVQMARWYRRAVLESVDQVYGAERWINLGQRGSVIQNDGSEGVPFPPAERRRIHKVVVAVGGPEGAPLPFGDFGKGFVHVFNESIFDTMLRTLDTVADFTGYLSAKEHLYEVSSENVVCDGELDLLASYLSDGRTFSVLEPVLVRPDAWVRFAASPELERKKKADEESYLWDMIIEMVAHDIEERTYEVGESSLPENEQIIRVMARESRLSRRVLSRAMWQLFERAQVEGWAARMVKSPAEKVGYVFLVRNAGVAKKLRAKELHVRTFIARAMLPDVDTVVGLATEVLGTAEHMSWVVTLFKPDSWHDHDQMFAICLSRFSGMFAEVRQQLEYEPEYPVDHRDKPGA